MPAVAAVAAVAAGGDGALAGVHARIAAYYTDKVQRFGCTPLGVDWSCVATQQMRFVQLLKLCDFSAPFSLNDVGCGYGALATFLHERHGACPVDYLGIDLAGAMVRRARRHCRGLDGVRFVRAACSPRIADFSLASGIFNVQLDAADESWANFITITLHQLAANSRRGFAVNFVDPLPDGAPPANGLFVTEPEPWARYCRDRFSAQVEVVRGYGMPESSMLVWPGRRC